MLSIGQVISEKAFEIFRILRKQNIFCQENQGMCAKCENKGLPVCS